MSITKEFREFAVKGNVIDLAVGVIIGAAFGKIVTSMVEDVLMPPLGAITGKIDFKDKFFSLDGATYATPKAAKDAGAPAIFYGNFINNLIQFAIVAFAIFLIFKAINKLRARMLKDEALASANAPLATPADQILLTEIRDELRARPL